MVRIYYQARDLTTGLTDVKITILNPDNTLGANAQTMTESLDTGVYYYDFTPTVYGYHHIRIDSASLPKVKEWDEAFTDSSSAGSASATYTTHAKVSAFLGMPAFSANTTPTATQVEDFIYRAQDYIDMRTNHSWRSTTVTDEYYPNSDIYENGFLKLYLNHRKIRTLATGSGDKIEIWDGSTWYDWIAAGTTKTQGRDKDWWVDYKNGILYLNTTSNYASDSIRLTYRYGDSTIPYDIEQAATMLAAIDVTFATQRSSARPDEANGAVASWKDRIESILTNRAEVRMIL